MQKDKNQLSFDATINLYYINPKMTEQDVIELEKIDAKLQASGTPDTQKIYVKSIKLKGDVVGLNQQLRALNYQKFSQNYPIEMYAEYSKKTKKIDNYPRLLKKIALTPFALIGDVILVPIVAISTIFK